MSVGKEVLTLLGAADTEHTQMRIQGVDATIVYRANETETARRAQAGHPAVTRMDWLDTLMTLPAGQPVPAGSLAPHHRRAVERLPVGCVDATPDGLVRVLARPLEVGLAIVEGRRWPPGLVRASRFAPYCRRVLVLSGMPGDVGQAAIEADFWGIGLVVNAGRAPEVVLPPAPFEEYRHTAAGWAFLEEIYRAATPGAVS